MRRTRKKKQNRFIYFVCILFIVVIALTWIIAKQTLPDDKQKEDQSLVTSNEQEENSNDAHKVEEEEPEDLEDDNGSEQESVTNQGEPDEPTGSSQPNEEELEPEMETDDETVVETAAEALQLAFVGDIMFSGNVEKLLNDQGDEYPFEHVKTYLMEADITIGNLETPLTTHGEAGETSFVYQSPPRMAPILKEMGIDVLNLANNHSFDQGAKGLLDTIEYLREANIETIGAGSNRSEAFQAAIIEQSGMKVGLIGVSRVIPDGSWKATETTPGLADAYDYTLPVEVISALRPEVDLLIVIAHWGEERVAYPNDIQVELAHHFIDAGADLIVASHPHVLQGFEQYKEKWIAYSLGNFIFTTRGDSPESWDTIVLQAQCTKQGDCQLDVVPLTNKWAQPKPVDSEESKRIIQHLEQISSHIRIDEQGRVHAKH